MKRKGTGQGKERFIHNDRHPKHNDIGLGSASWHIPLVVRGVEKAAANDRSSGPGAFAWVVYPRKGGGVGLIISITPAGEKRGLLLTALDETCTGLRSSM